MALNAYGVLAARAVARRRETGDTPHYQIHLTDDAGVSYRAAVNVQSQQAPSELLYLADDDLRHPITAPLAGLAPGWHPLPPRGGGPNLDFIRGNLFDLADMRALPPERPGVDNDLSDRLDHYVLRAIAHILLAKLYRKPIEAVHANRYRRHLGSEAVTRRAEQVRRSRGRKNISTPEGHHYHLEEIFEQLNRQFFNGLLGRPILTWSAHSARRLLGHYDAAHNTIVVSRVFDRAETPRYAIEYLLFHEMLHLKHPVQMRNGRRCVHSREFQRDEKIFPELEKVKEYLKKL